MEDVISFINSLNINEPVVLACSYGPDSMLLLDVLYKLNLNIIVAHVNHKIRKESEDEYCMLKEYCNERNIIFEGYEINNYPKGNFENNARVIRYNFFEDILKKYNSHYLFTAHHGDDLIETILMRINRGSSFKGYSGFNKITKLDNYFLVRPLIYLTKSFISDYNDKNGIPYALDSTNFEFDHTRNIFRHKVLPELKKINPDIHNKFLKFSNNIINYYNYVNEEVNSYKGFMYKNKCLDINELNMLPEFIIKLLIESILLDIYKDNINFLNDKHVDMIVSLINSNKSNSMINLPLNFVCYKFYNIIDIRKKEEVFNYEYVLDKEFNINNGYIAYVDDTDIIKSNYLIRLNSNDIKFPLHIRNRHIGDRIELKNGTKKIGEILSEAKMSKLDRDIYPLVCDDDGKILWIPGVKKSKYDRQIDEEYDIIIKYIKKEKDNEKEK